jgi:hypothetical protein
MMCGRKVMSVADEGGLERPVSPNKAANTHINMTYIEQNHSLRFFSLARTNSMHEVAFELTPENAVNEIEQQNSHGSRLTGAANVPHSFANEPDRRAPVVRPASHIDVSVETDGEGFMSVAVRNYLFVVLRQRTVGFMALRSP